MENDSEKKEIWDKLFIRKEDTQRSLPEIAKKLLKYLQIDIENDNKIIFNKSVSKISDKIKLLLIVFFVLKEKGEIEVEHLNISEIDKKLGIKKTTLSKPLGILVNEGYVKKDKEGNYSIIHYKINEIFEGIENERN